MCCVCSENTSCEGCESGQCKDKDWCVNRKCSMEKGLRGCWECEGLDSCKGNMLDKPRIRAFCEYMRKHGEDKLKERLCENERNGLKYHYEGQLIGDYDKGTSTEEIFAIIDGAKAD